MLLPYGSKPAQFMLIPPSENNVANASRCCLTSFFLHLELSIILRDIEKRRRDSADMKQTQHTVGALFTCLQSNTPGALPAPY